MLPSKLPHLGDELGSTARIAALTFLEWFAYRLAVVSLFSAQ
jgi:hypothetical protein